MRKRGKRWWPLWSAKPSPEEPRPWKYWRMMEGGRSRSRSGFPLLEVGGRRRRRNRCACTGLASSPLLCHGRRVISAVIWSEAAGGGRTRKRWESQGQEMRVVDLPRISNFKSLWIQRCTKGFSFFEIVRYSATSESRLPSPAYLT